VLPDAQDMQQFNRYAYVINNPLKYTDPTGHVAECAFCAFVIASGLNFIFGGDRGPAECSRRCGEQGLEFGEVIVPEFIVSPESPSHCGRIGTCVFIPNPLFNAGSDDVDAQDVEIIDAEGPSINFSIGLGGISFGFGSDEGENNEGAGFFFTQSDARQTLEFFFENVGELPGRGVIRGISPDQILSNLSLGTELTSEQVLIAFEIATTFALVAPSGLFLGDVVSVVGAISAPFRIGTAIGRIGAVFNVSTSIDRARTGRDIRGFLNDDFQTFRRGVIGGLFLGGELNGTGTRAFATVRNVLSLPGGIGEIRTRIEVLLDEFN